jgi:5-methylcytosine-specific restriction enzyme A
MKMSDLTDIIENQTGFAVRLRLRQEGQSGKTAEFIPRDINPAYSFTIFVRLGWRSLEAEFKLGNYARGLLDALEKTPVANRDVFSKRAIKLQQDGVQIEMMINSSPVDATAPRSWPAGWNTFNLIIKKTPTDPGGKDLAFDWCSKILNLVVPILPLEETEAEEEHYAAGLPEGAKIRIEVNRYERSRLNRDAAIDFHGAVCNICEFDFGKVYGLEAAGYIHVHHIVPVSKLGDNYMIDPSRDLIPVCPNCHAMLHQTNPPRSAEEIKNMLKKQGYHNKQI